MKKSLFAAIFIIMMLFGIFQMVNTSNNSYQKIEKTLYEEKVQTQIEQLTLEEKIGQMFMISYSSETMENTIKQIMDYKPGGIILFKNNFKSYEETYNQIHQMESITTIPLFISVDQEGGRVQRLQELEDASVTIIPPMQLVGSTRNSLLSYGVGKVVGEELQVFGINMDFAPVLDIVSDFNNQVIGNRSFGSDAKTVSGMGIAFANGLEDSGVIAVYKHFPGHGSTISDSHSVLPIISKTKEELVTSDLIPFQKAIDAGADIIMVGHLAVPSISHDETPASLSPAIITGLLKEEMGYQGLVVTDALNMGAITKYYSEKEIYERAIQAGVDILLMPVDLGRAIAYIKESIAEGQITEQQIDESVRKILLLKYQKLSSKKLDKTFLGSQKHQFIIEKVYDYFKN